MTRVVAAIALVLIAAFSVPRETAAQQAASVSTVPAYYYVTANPCLNLRTGPSGAYRVVECMPRNRVVRVRSLTSTGWARVYDPKNGALGYAAGSYLNLYRAPAADAPPASSGYCMTNYWGEYVCASPNVASAIRYWFGQYGISPWWGFATSSCESSFNVYAYNPASGVTGLFQFQPSTFYWQGGSNLSDPWDQSRVAAKMFAGGLGYMFACAVMQGW